MDEVVIVIPTLEPDDKLIELIKQIRESKLSNNTIIIINDGSKDTYEKIFEKVRLEYGVVIKKHEVNKGKGRALKTAIEWILAEYPQAKGIVTIDSDGQHTVDDMIACMDAFVLQENALILGVRNFSKGVPLKSKFGNVLTRNVLSLSSGIAIEDTQTGLRVISQKFMKRLLEVDGERFEFEMNMLLYARKGQIPIVEVPISTIYLDDNKPTHFRALQDSALIYGVFLKYVFSAISSFIIDISIFTLLLKLLSGFSFEIVLVASVVARAASSLFNYVLNRLVVFEKGSLKSLVRYYGLVLIQIIISSLFVSVFKYVLPETNTTFIKIIVDGTLFFFSFYIQKKYVFKQEVYMKDKKMLIYWLAGISAVVYLLWRTFYTLPIHDSLFALIVGVLLLISEVISSFTAFILIWSKHKYKELVKPEVSLEDYPDVDVFIATHNEDYDLLYKTVNGCKFMDYPDKSKVHIYICDDKNRSEIKALADEFGVTHLGVENNTHAKSGNLNYALSQTNSPLIATFDADMIPYSAFLMETVPYFIAPVEEGEKPIGLVQTPQSFYNADLFQYNLFAEESIPNEQDFFSREVNVLNNAHDCAIYTGSNTVISRQAIEEAGRFPTNTITEDFQLGVAINTCGYKTISTLEPMASGLTPKDIPGVLKQRIRWARGVLKSVYNMKVVTNKKLTPAQRIVFLNSYLYWWSFSRRLLYIMAPILFTVFNVRIVATNFWVLVLFWLPSYMLLKLAMRDVTSDIRSERWGEIQETIFAPYLLIPVFLESIGITEKTFKVTNKATKDSKMDRLFVLPHLILLVLSIIGLVKFNYGKFGSELFYGSVISFWLMHHILNLTFAVLYCFKRPFYRTNERFLLKEEVIVQQDDKQFSLKTDNLSEDGLSFKSTKPIYLDTTKPVDLEVRTEKYKAKLSGKIVRVISKSNEWIYGVSLNQPDEENFNQYLQIMHDRFNQYLPLKRDVWMTPADELIEILARRLQLIEKKQDTNQLVQASIYLDEEVEVSGQKATLIQFDFNDFYFKTPNTLPLAKEFLFEYQGVSFTLLFDHYVVADNVYGFKIVNLAEIAQEESFLNILTEWGNES